MNNLSSLLPGNPVIFGQSGQARFDINFNVTINKERGRTLTQIKKTTSSLQKPNISIIIVITFAICM